MIIAVTQNHPDLPTQTVFVDTDKVEPKLKFVIETALRVNDTVFCDTLVHCQTQGVVRLPAYVEAEIDLYYES